MISFVYFDLGGVVILDFSGTNNWEIVKKEWGITDEYWDKFEPKLCEGKEKISPEFLNAFVSRFEPNPSIVPVLNEVHKTRKIGLLTNQYPGMLEAIQKKGLLPNITWDVVIDSSIEKVRKPNKEIFELAEQRSGFKGQEILFVENSEKHVKAASGFGWRTFLYDPVNPELSSQSLLDLFLTIV